MFAPVVKCKKVFLSYTLRDGIIDKSLLKSICELLSPTYDVFADAIHNDSVDKQKRVIDELHSSQYVVVLNTPLISESPWVNIEIDEANKMGIPILQVEVNSNFFDARYYAKKIMDWINE